jgi:hypothetical protein
LYGCKARSLILREEQGPRVFGNRLVWKITGPKKDEVTGKWRRLQMRSLMTVLLTKYMVIKKSLCT